jgi:hypothetical protein
LNKIVERLAQDDHSKVWHSLTEGTSTGKYLYPSIQLELEKTYTLTVTIFFLDSSLHLSLSRPAFLKTNERDNFIEELKKVVKGMKM